MDAKQLQAGTGCSAELAPSWLPFLESAMLCFDVDSPARQAAFLAQIGHESGGLKRLEENLNYDAKGLRRVWPNRFSEADALAYARHPERIANRVYARHELGNGDEASGDGWRFRGRGLIQLTGRVNYRDCGRGISMDLLTSPDLLLGPEGASMSAAWFWWSHNANHFADLGDFERVTRIVNGGLNGFQERCALWAKAKAALGVA